MIDIILLAFSVSLFVGGFWCGKTFGTFKATKEAFFKLFR